MRTLLLIPALFTLTLFSITLLAEDINDISYEEVVGSITCASMAAVGNIKRVNDKETAGKQIVSRIWLIDVDQIDDTQPFPRPTADRKVGTIPLKSGEVMHYFMGIDDQTEEKSSGAKGDITTEVTNEVSFIVGGHRASILKFLEDHAGGRFIIIYQMTDGSYWILGNDLKPMILKSFERSNGKDSRSTTLTFGNTSFEQPKEYIGTIATVAPTALAADAAVLPIGTAQEYATSANNAQAVTISSFTGLSTSDIGRTIEIIGGGGTYPTSIEDADGIVLRNAETWTGNAGSRIIFTILDTDTIVEVSRVQTA